MQSQASYRSASSSPSARRPSSGFDGVNEEANVRANAAVVDGHADVRASAVITDDNDDDADDGLCCLWSSHCLPDEIHVVSADCTTMILPPDARS